MTDENLKIEFEQLKKDIFSEDWELVKSAADRLGEIGGDEVVDFLISLLSLENSGIRNRAALALRDIGDNKAVKPLLKAIFKKENLNYNGTMVYALEALDCSKNLKEIFKILFYQGAEAKLSADTILSEQIFTFYREDILIIKRMWDDCKLHPEKCPDYDDIDTREMMESAVEGFMRYLEPKALKNDTSDSRTTRKKPSS